MSDNEDLLVRREDRVLRVTINRPDKHNPLSRSVLAALREAFTQAGSDPSVGAVVLRGAGTRYFAAGGDLRDLGAVRTREETLTMAAESRAALDAVRECPVPVVALVNGDAIGGGGELALACDFRVMSARAHIGYIHGRLNITTAWGGGTDLVALIGPARALRMTARCELIDADTALAWGLADAVADEAGLDAAGDDFIAPMLRQTPLALRACKEHARAFRRGVPYEARRAIEQRNLVETWVAPEHWAAVDRILNRQEAK